MAEYISVFSVFTIYKSLLLLLLHKNEYKCNHLGYMKSINDVAKTIVTYIRRMNNII